VINYNLPSFFSSFGKQRSPISLAFQSTKTETNKQTHTVHFLLSSTTQHNHATKDWKIKEAAEKKEQLG
jgi:hypothetical protein